MIQEELIQKLTKEVVSQRVLILSLAAALIKELHPENTHEAYGSLVKEWVLKYRDARPQVLGDMASEFGLPLSIEAQADLGITGEFESWFRKEIDGEQ